MPDSKPIVLIVDDEEAGRRSLEDALVRHGYELVMAASGREALEKATERAPDLVLLDLMMPDMDGFEVCRRLRSDPQLAELPVIMITALDDRESRVRGLEAGADDFLSKPFDRAELRARVRTVTRLNRFRRLLDERGKVERLVTLSPDGILVISADGEVLVANAASERLFDVVAGVLEGEPLWRFIDEEQAGHCRDCFQQVMTEQIESMQMESVFQRAEGSSFPVEISVGFCVWDGEPACELVVRDVSDRKRLEAEIQRAQRLDAIGRTTSAVAHDFGNYLTAIRGNADLLVMDLAEGSEERESAEEIIKVVKRAVALTRQLLTFAREQKRKVDVLDLNAVVRDLDPMLQRLAGRDVKLGMEYASEPVRIKIDKTQVEQVVVNLVVNARDAMPDGGTVTVQTSLVVLDQAYVNEHPDARLGEHVVLTVRDTGHGMDAETKAKVFEPFFTTKGEGKGTGLGLATVYGVVKQSEGHVRLESEVGVGTSFRLYFPRVVDAIG